MRKANVLVLLLSVVLAVVLSGSSLALVMLNTHPELELAEPVIGPQTRLPQISSGIPYAEPAESKGNPLGSTYLAGTTWYDYQHNGTISKMVSLTASGGVHVCWMNGLELNAANRHIYYNYFKDGAFSWPGLGYKVDQESRGGYACLDNFSTGEVVITFHQGNGPWYAAAAYDFIEGFGAFQITNAPLPLETAEMCWPHITVDAQDYIHMVAHEYGPDVWQRISYTRSEDGGNSFADWTVVDTIVSISGDIAASPVSNKVGMVYAKSYFDVMNLGPYASLLVSQLNNGITLVESDDGVTWDLSAKQDITDLVQPDSTRYPDSTWANGDTLRCYCDVSLLYDMNDNAHAAFTTRGFWFDASLYSPPPNSPSDSFAVLGHTYDASMIWHWSEEHDTITAIADGWYDVGDPDAPANEYAGAGAWRSTCDRPSLGVDPTTGYLYCVYERCVEGDTSGGPVPSHGFANGEVYCSVSTDGGLNWSEGTNLTNTPTPEAIAGACMDEDYPSLASVVNDTLHVLYIEDKDAGGVVQTAPQEGTWTENPVRYQKVPASLVPPGPPYVPNFEFHVGPSTAVEQPTLLSGTMPESYALYQNYPNPFNPETEIKYAIPSDVSVTLKVYNVLGAEVATLVNASQKAGIYSARWDARDLASGVYFCRLQAGDFTATRKMVLLK